MVKAEVKGGGEVAVEEDGGGGEGGGAGRGGGGGGGGGGDVDRGTWSGRLDFVMSALSFAVGMGNLWRFPYLCYRSGGGAFLVPYIFAMIVAGYPLMFIELALGQYGKQGVVSIWKACPIFEGIGWGMFAVSVFTSIYYNMIIAWCFFYMFASFARDVPWRSCDSSWNSPACASSELRAIMTNCTVTNGTFIRPNNTCVWRSQLDHDNDWSTLVNQSASIKTISATDDFFHKYMLDISGGFGDMGAVRWQLALCLLLCWIIVFLSLAKGIKVSGKVTYVTALFPYLVLFILLIRGVTLEGSVDGILYYITPRWEQLASARVWGDAAVQVFFSLSLCWGGLITLSSYNKFNNDCLRDTIIVATGDMLTSIFGGFVIFSLIGFMAHELQVPVSKVATDGPGLAFIVYPEGIAQLPIAPLWSILFMLMLINVGLGSQMGIVSTVHLTIIERFQEHFMTSRRRILLLAAICSVIFLLGLSICSRGGMYIFVLLDTYSASYALLLLALMECVAIAWVYGVNRFYEDIEQMIGYKLHWYWKIFWKFLSPAFVIFIFIFILVDFKRTRYGDYVFPKIWDVMGWGIPTLIVGCVPAVALFKIWNADKSLSFKQRAKSLMQPTSDWGKYAAIDCQEKQRMNNCEDGQVLTELILRAEGETPIE